jgi:hypothetical protein
VRGIRAAIGSALGKDGGFGEQKACGDGGSERGGPNDKAETGHGHPPKKQTEQLQAVFMVARQCRDVESASALFMASLEAGVMGIASLSRTRQGNTTAARGPPSRQQPS